MTPFEPDGVFNSIKYRVLPDLSVEALLSAGVVKFKNMDQFRAACVNGPTNSNVQQTTLSIDALVNPNQRKANVPIARHPTDYYSLLQQAIKTTAQNSAQMRALVYERVRFNLKRDALFGSTDLADAVQQINEFELAVARIEANARDDDPIHEEREQYAPNDGAHAEPRNATQILPPRRAVSPYVVLNPIQWMDSFQHARLSEEFVRYVRTTTKFIGSALLGIALIGIAVIASMLWLSPRVSPQIEAAKESLQATEAAINRRSFDNDAVASTDSAVKVPYPLPTSFGIYVLSDNKLAELKPLPINIPDPRIMLSAELRKPSTTTVADSRPAFILFQRDLLTSAPQKIMLRVIAKVARETKFVNGKPIMTHDDGIWRIRNISRELRISPVPGQREMVIARLDDNVSTLTAGRYALVLNRVGYDFTVEGPVQSLAFCLEEFETVNGSMFTQCRSP